MRLLLQILIFALTATGAVAQSSPNWSYGQVPTAGQFNAAFATKQDVLTFVPLNRAGGTMMGKLSTYPSTINNAGFAILPGVAPTNPSNGDLWIVGNGLFAQLGNQTTGIAPLISPTFTGTVTIPTLAITGSGSTGDVSVTSVTPTGSGVSAFLNDIIAALRPQAANNAALKTSGTWFNAIRRNGFATPGDGGAMDYTWSPTNCATPDDGAQVQPTGRTGCWIADFPPGRADIRVWGAQAGQAIDNALDAAIAWAAKTHVTISLPFPSGSQQYLLIRGHTIGNGTATQLSTVNNVRIEITGDYGESTSGTTPPLLLPFKYTGSNPNDIPFNLQGPASTLSLFGIGVDCNQICKTGIKINNVINSEWGRISVQGHVGTAVVLTTTQNNTWGAGIEGNRLHDWWLVVPGPGGSGIQIGDITCTTCNYSVISNIFDNITINWDSTNTNSFGILWGYATQNTLNRFRVTYDPIRGGTSGTPMKVSPPPGALNFPTANTFNDPAFSGTADAGPANWAPSSANGITFNQYNTTQSPFPVATTYGNYTGTDAAGNRYPVAANWTPVDASGAGLALTVQSATYVKRGKDVIVNIALTYPTTADTRAATIGGIPFTAESGGVSRFGGAISYTDVGSPITLLVNDNASTVGVYNYSGGGVNNASLSGKSIRATFVYRSN